MKPSTPLPWTIVSGYQSKRYDKQGVDSTFISWGVSGADADYACHAANAYPRLVAALRELLWHSPRDLNASHRAECYLREIGELK